MRMPLLTVTNVPLPQNWAPEPWGKQVCPLWLQRKLLHEWVARGWAGPVTLTPCDLWRFIGPAGHFQGRTLWLIGDSQVRNLHSEAALAAPASVLQHLYRSCRLATFGSSSIRALLWLASSFGMLQSCVMCDTLHYTLHCFLGIQTRLHLTLPM